jgi:hypothetical protein
MSYWLFDFAHHPWECQPRPIGRDWDIFQASGAQANSPPKKTKTFDHGQSPIPLVFHGQVFPVPSKVQFLLIVDLFPTHVTALIFWNWHTALVVDMLSVPNGEPFAFCIMK